MDRSPPASQASAVSRDRKHAAGPPRRRRLSVALLAVLIVASLSGAGVYVWRRASVQPASGQGAALPSPTATTSSPEPPPPSPEPTPSAVLHPTPSIGLPTRDLTYGDKGRQVRNLQLLLKGLGYDIPATDGR